MFILKDEKIIQKLKDYEKDFQNDDYVFACIEGGLKKKNRVIMGIIMFIVIIGAYQVMNDNIIAWAIIGGFIGVTTALTNDFCILVTDNKKINLYLFNKLMSKVINKIELPFNDIEIRGTKKAFIWNTIKIKTKVMAIKLVMSEKTIGLSKQKDNTNKLAKILDSVIIK